MSAICLVAIMGVATGLLVYIVWFEWLGCHLRGHTYDQRWYSPTFCTRASRHVGPFGRHEQ